MNPLKLIFAALITGILSAPLVATADMDQSHGYASDQRVEIMYGEGGAFNDGGSDGKGDSIGDGKGGGSSTDGEGGA